jgi:hypothetical protein
MSAPGKKGDIRTILAAVGYSLDIIAKLPKCHAINFLQIDQTSRKRRPMSPPGRYRSRL